MAKVDGRIMENPLRKARENKGDYGFLDLLTKKERTELDAMIEVIEEYEKRLGSPSNPSQECLNSEINYYSNKH